MAAVDEWEAVMTFTQDLLADPPAMAEMVGGALEAQTDAMMDATAHGVDASAVVAAEFAAEGHATPGAVHDAATAVDLGLAALEAETED